MRIGTKIFYACETARQDYITATHSSYPIGVLSSLAFFVGFANRTPIHSKLYRELGYSVALGAMVSYAYAYRWYSKYIEVIDQSYDVVRERFADRPDVLERGEAEGMSARVVKNFGLSAWNDPDTDGDFAFDDANTPVMKGSEMER